LWKKNFNCCCKKHLYEVEIGFNNISREHVVKSGGNWMQNSGSNLIEQSQMVRLRPTPNEDESHNCLWGILDDT
jgi:hypothetical protein